MAADEDGAVVEADEAELLDRLRRRLYDRDATDADRRRYEDLRARLEAAEPTTETEPRRRDPRPRRAIAAAGLLGGTLVLVALLLPVGRPGPMLGSSTAPPSPTGLLPTPVEVSVQGAAVTGQRFSGRGGARLALVTGSAPPFGGRLVVALTSDGPGPLGWQAVRTAVRTDHASYEQVVAQSAPAPRSDLGHPETTRYDGDPPSDVVVRADGGTAWTLTVLLLDPEPSRPR